MTLLVDGIVAGPHILGDFDSGFGSIDVTIAGGTMDYTYSWSAILADGSTFESSAEDLEFLFAGTYSLTVTDENGCSVSEDITVPFYAPAEWSVNETGGIHEIDVPSTANITIDYDAISYGDYLAVADADGNIGGMIMWNGQFDVLNAYGSEFKPNEVFNWLIWDASTDIYYVADAVSVSYTHLTLPTICSV